MEQCLEAQEDLRHRLETITLPLPELQDYLDNAHIFKDTAPGAGNVTISMTLTAISVPLRPHPPCSGSSR